MENITTVPLRGGQGAGGGRKPGTRLTQPSTFVARLREKMGVSQENLAREIGLSERTARSYEKKNIVPIKGEARQKLEQLGRIHSVSFEEPQA